jgi:hypothetical protein
MMNATKRVVLIKVLERLIEGLKDDKQYTAPYTNLNRLDGCKAGILEQHNGKILINIDLENK